MLRILSINIHFVVQRPSGREFKAAIFDLNGEKTSSDTIGRYAGSSLANTAGIGINSSKDTVHVINVALGHARRPDGGAETRLCIFYASAMVADFTRSHVVILTGSVRRFCPHLVSVIEYA